MFVKITSMKMSKAKKENYLEDSGISSVKDFDGIHLAVNELSLSS